MDDSYGIFWALYHSVADLVAMHEAWSITKECAVTQLNLA